MQKVLGLLQLILVPGFTTLLAYIYFDFVQTGHTAYSGLLLPGSVLLTSLLVTRAFSAVFEQASHSRYGRYSCYSR